MGQQTFAIHLPICLVLGLQVPALAVYVGTGAETQILTLVQPALGLVFERL